MLGSPLGPGARTSGRQEGAGPGRVAGWKRLPAGEKAGSGDDHERSRKAPRWGRVHCLTSLADPASYLGLGISQEQGPVGG